MNYSSAHPLTSPIILNDRLQMVEDLSILPRTISQDNDYGENLPAMSDNWNYVKLNNNMPICKGHKNGYNAGAFGKKKK